MRVVAWIVFVLLTSSQVAEAGRRRCCRPCVPARCSVAEEATAAEAVETLNVPVAPVPVLQQENKPVAPVGVTPPEPPEKPDAGRGGYSLFLGPSSDGLPALHRRTVVEINPIRPDLQTLLREKVTGVSLLGPSEPTPNE